MFGVQGLEQDQEINLSGATRCVNWDFGFGRLICRTTQHTRIDFWRQRRFLYTVPHGTIPIRTDSFARNGTRKGNVMHFYEFIS